MILVDTSVWVDFLRGTARVAEITTALTADDILLHPWVRGELHLGGALVNAQFRRDLFRLPSAPLVSSEDLEAFIDAHKLAGAGIGYVDAQLLASATLARAELMTSDKNLATAARRVKQRLR